MLSTPVPPSDVPHKDEIESLRKQIDSHFGEINRLRYAINLHAAVSNLPTELLAEVFLHIIESGLRDGDTCFAANTFIFLLVCRRWNEVAVGFPHLWDWWVPGAVEAWPLFRSRSRNTSLFLTWRFELSTSARDVLMDPKIPRRVRRLKFSGTSEQLTQFFGAFDSSPASNVSSIRLQISSYDDHEPEEHLARFLSSSFPKLSQLDLENFLPACSSPIFTTSNFASLKLSLPDGKKNPFTLSQFAQFLQRHPNLQELDLSCGAIPLPGPSSCFSVPLVLPRSVNLRLHGTKTAILGFVDLIDISSSLLGVTLCFSNKDFFSVRPLVNTMKQILVTYYKRQRPNHPRKVSRIKISYNSEKRRLVFNSRSHSTHTSNHKSNLTFKFYGIGEQTGIMTVEEVFPLFPLDDVQEFTAKGWSAEEEYWYRGMFQKMKDLSHLRLEKVYAPSVLTALSPHNRNGPQPPILPKLESLTLSHLDIEDCELLYVLERRNHNAHLQKLVMESCIVFGAKTQTELMKLVGKVELSDLRVLDEIVFPRVESSLSEYEPN